MVRMIKEPAVRRNEILDAAQRFLFHKGYEQMTIQDILDDIHISRGAFYHYFDSKQALLEGLIERTGEEEMKQIRPILTDPELNALQKLQIYFGVETRFDEFLRLQIQLHSQLAVFPDKTHGLNG